MNAIRNRCAVLEREKRAYRKRIGELNKNLEGHGAVRLSPEIPFRDGDEDTTLKYTTYMLAMVWERLHITGEILGERIVRGEERSENNLDIAAGFRVFQFDYDHAGFGAGIKYPLAGRDYGLIFSLMHHF